MEERQKKRSIIIFIYFLLLVFFVGGIYIIVKPKETCSDGKLNQNEEQIDCGGVCRECKKLELKDLTIGKAGILKNNTADSWDVYVEIFNPNQIYGSEKLEYQIIFKNDKGEEVFSKKGFDFILPGERKYLIENNVKLEKPFSSIEAKVVSSQWVGLLEYYERPQLKIGNKAYNELKDGTVFSESRGILRNESTFDFSLIKIKVVLKDENENVIALNSTEVRTVKSGEEREYVVIWPTVFPGEVRKIEVYPEVNVFDSHSFVEKYFQSQQFKKY